MTALRDTNVSPSHASLGHRQEELALVGSNVAAYGRPLVPARM